MSKAPRTRHPRINCSVPGCNRGTTAFEPGTDMICGPCWRRAPLALRRRFGNLSRRAKAAERRDDARTAWRAWRLHRRTWERILALLTAPPSDSDDIPPLVAEQLRKDGIL